MLREFLYNLRHDPLFRLGILSSAGRYLVVGLMLSVIIFDPYGTADYLLGQLGLVITLLMGLSLALVLYTDKFAGIRVALLVIAALTCATLEKQYVITAERPTLNWQVAIILVTMGVYGWLIKPLHRPRLRIVPMVSLEPIEVLGTNDNPDEEHDEKEELSKES